MPNPFVARRISAGLAKGLQARGLDPARRGAASGEIIGRLRVVLTRERDTRSESLFRSAVKAGDIRFRLRLDGNNAQMPDHMLTTEPANLPDLTDGNGDALNRSLVSPVFRNHFNRLDQNVAVHLDRDATVKSWHRNVANAGYDMGLQGRTRGRQKLRFVARCRHLSRLASPPPS